MTSSARKMIIVRGIIIETDIIRKDCSVLPIILKLIYGTYLWRYFQISFGRKICEPNCASFPAWKSTPATVWFLSPTMESNADCWAPSVPLFTTIKRTQESSDGLFFTEENTRRVSGNWFFRQVFISSHLEDAFYTDVIFVQNQHNLCLLVKKLPSRDVSDVTSRHQKPLLVFLSLSFWPRSNKSQRYVLICPPSWTVLLKMRNLDPSKATW